MKRLKLAGVFTLMVIVLFMVSNFLYLLGLRPTEEFPEDTYLKTVTNKKALIVVAHDDDASTFAGIAPWLEVQGWEVDYLCFYKGVNDDVEKIRKQEVLNAAKIQGFRNVHLIDFDPIKNVKPELIPWHPMPYNEFSKRFWLDSLNQYIADVILESKPSVIISLDDMVGGYGHPEHIIVGQSVHKVSLELNDEGIGDIKKLYQYVFPNSQEFQMMATQEVFKMAKETYNAPEGMPDPDVFIYIDQFAEEKMSTLEAYASQKRNLKKFVKFYNWYPAWIYFRVFNKEHFRVIDL